MSATRFGSTLALLAMLSAMPACGGGGGDGGGSNSQSRVTYSIAALDGSVRSDNAWSATQSPLAGDVDADVNGVGVGAYYTFDVGTISPGSVILGATLGIYQRQRFGDPYGRLNSLRVTYAPYGASLGGAVGLVVPSPPFPPYFTPGCLTECSLESEVKGLLERALADGHAQLQVRVGFTNLSDSNNITDAIGLTDGKSATNKPYLSVQWQDP